MSWPSRPPDPESKSFSEIGVQKIREKSKRQTTKLIDLATSTLASQYTARSRKAGGTVSIDMPNSKEVCRELLKRDVLVDWRRRPASACLHISTPPTRTRPAIRGVKRS